MHEQIYITPSHLVEQIRIPDHQGLSRQADHLFSPAASHKPRSGAGGRPQQGCRTAQDAHRCHPVFPLAERPQAPDGPRQQEDSQPAPGQRQGGLDPPPPEEPPFFQQGTAPILEDQHTAQRRGQDGQPPLPWGSQIHAGPQRRQGQHPQGRPQAGGGKKTEPAHSVHPRHLPGPSSSPRRSQLSYRQTLGH